MATYPLSEAYIDGDILSASDVNSITEGVNDIAFGVFNAQTGTSYTLALTDSGVDVRSQGAKLKIAGQYGVAGLLKIDTDEWVAFGNLAA
jgi:hypothetical protein